MIGVFKCCIIPDGRDCFERVDSVMSFESPLNFCVFYSELLSENTDRQPESIEHRTEWHHESKHKEREERAFVISIIQRNRGKNPTAFAST